MTKNILENLAKDNWKTVGNYARLIILAKGNDRMLYDPKTETITSTYKFNEG